MTVSTDLSGFTEALRADGPAEGLSADKLMTYGQLVGDWTARIVDHRENPPRELSGEVHVDWILEGRALQDVWIAPARAERTAAGANGPIDWFGTTLRVYHPASESWRITWINPRDGTEVRLVGRVVGDEIIQEGMLDGGIPVRWIFSDLAPRSYRWRCEVSGDQRKSWNAIITAELERADSGAEVLPGANGGDIARLVEQLRQMHQGEAWHGPSVREALEGVTAAGATRRPIPDAHTIRELVHHLRVNTDGVRRRLAGEPPGDEPDWPEPGTLDPSAWRKELEHLITSQEALREALARLPASRLHRAMPGKQHSYWYEIAGILNHDAYHAGQLSLLKKGG